MAAWCKPEQMLLIGTDELLKMEDRIRFLLSRVASRIEKISFVRVDDPIEAGIYRAVRKFMHESGIPLREVFIDPTGGKKSMSASAALAGFLAGAPLVYVDYGKYHASNRPIAGTEYPRLLTNPLDIVGDVELKHIFAAFNRSDFHEAEWRAEQLAYRIYDKREAECLADLARGYGAWDRFPRCRHDEELT